MDTTTLLNTLTRLVDERGRDWTYPPVDGCADCAEYESEHGWYQCQWHTGNVCRYFTDDGEPACIVGALVADCGYQAFDVDTYEAENADTLLKHIDLDLEDWHIELLNEMQRKQDKGDSWGMVLDWMKKHAEGDSA
jgi:hypothetical protein